MNKNRTQSGKSLVVLSLFLTLVIAASLWLFWYFVRPGAEEPGNHPAGDPGETAMVTEPPSDVQGSTADPDNAPGAPAEDATPAPVEEAGTWVIAGTVTDQAGKPVPKATVQWIHMDEDRLETIAHDGRVFGNTAAPENMADEKIRRRLTEGKRMQTDADGRYRFEGIEIKPDREARLGCVVAHAEGFKAAMEPVQSGKVEEGGDDASKEVTIDLTLEPGGRITGKVTDRATGKPVPGMYVYAGEIDPDASVVFLHHDSDAPKAETGADGIYIIQGLSDGEYRVTPRTGRSHHVSMPFSRGKKVFLEKGSFVTEVDFQVDRGGTIHVTVIDPDDKALAGAFCQVLPKDIMSLNAQDRLEVAMGRHNGPVTDADGCLEMRGLPLGEAYRVMARKEGFAAGRSDDVELTVEKPDAQVALTLILGWSISGRVVYSDGEPAPEERVYLMPDIAEMVQGLVLDNSDTRTDASGAFRFEHLDRGRFNLTAGEGSPQAALFGGEGAVSVELDGSDDVTGVELTIQREEESPEASISGRVVDNWGQPVKGVTVNAHEMGGAMMAMGMRSNRRADTDGDGQFRITGVKPDGIYMIDTMKSGYTKGEARRVHGGTQDVSLVMERYGKISGRIIVPEGLAVGTGGKVKPMPVQQDASKEAMRFVQRFMGNVTSDGAVAADGAFSVEAPPGEIEVQATLPGFAQAYSAPIKVMPGQDYTGIEIKVTVGAIIYGKVVLHDNTPVENATVTVQSGHQRDAYRARLAKLLPHYFSSARNSAVTNQAGVYEIPFLQHGDYEVTARHDSYAPSETLQVKIAQDEEKEIPDLILSEGGKIIGVVSEKKDAGNAPRAGMMVQLMGNGAMQQAMTDGTGAFQFKGLGPGKYTVQFVDIAAMQKQKIGVKLKAVVLEGDETVTLDYEMGAGYKVHGRIKGVPKGGMTMIYLSRPGGPPLSSLSQQDVEAQFRIAEFAEGMTMVSSDGDYEIGDLESGEYVLQVPRMQMGAMGAQPGGDGGQKPLFEKTITIKDKNLKLDIDL